MDSDPTTTHRNVTGHSGFYFKHLLRLELNCIKRISSTFRAFQRGNTEISYKRVSEDWKFYKLALK